MIAGSVASVESDQSSDVEVVKVIVAPELEIVTPTPPPATTGPEPNMTPGLTALSDSGEALLKCAGHTAIDRAGHVRMFKKPAGKRTRKKRRLSGKRPKHHSSTSESELESEGAENQALLAKPTGAASASGAHSTRSIDVLKDFGEPTEDARENCRKRNSKDNAGNQLIAIMHGSKQLVQITHKSVNCGEKADLIADVLLSMCELGFDKSQLMQAKSKYTAQLKDP